MAALQLFKIRINNACKLVKSHESQVDNIDVPFTFPAIKEQCEDYIKEKTGALANLLNSLQNAVKLQETQLSAAIAYINALREECERETLVIELSKHLELEALDLEVMAVQWQNRIQFRQHELREQTTFMHMPGPSILVQPMSELGLGSATERSERHIKIRKPLLEIPTFSGNFREFNSFWTVFESLIHCDEDLSDGDKFLFLKQALKGKAAAALNCIPVVGDKYLTAVNILKKHFDRSANMADILINEIERLHGAKDDPESCRETFEAINSRIIHLEQTGMRMNADRIWRRMILSKFPENICATVIQKEVASANPFDVSEILDKIDDIISLRETTALTMKTLFPSSFQTSNHQDTSIDDPKWEEEKEYLEQFQFPTSNIHHLQASGTRRRTNIAYGKTSEERVARNLPSENKVYSSIKSPVAHQSVLQTASAMIFDEEDWDYQPITILIDSGAQRSFIRSGLSEDLKLPVLHSTSFTTSGMGEMKETFSSNEVQVTLKSLHSAKKLKKISVHTKEKLTTNLHTAHLTDADVRTISSRNLMIAQDTLTHKSVLPNLIIGQDLLNLVTVHTERVLKLPSGLILTPTIFGYVISGTSRTNVRTDLVGTFGCTSTMQDGSKFVHHPQQHAKWLTRKKTDTNFNESSTRRINGKIFPAYATATSQKRTKSLPEQRKSRIAALDSEAEVDRQRWLAKVRCILGSSGTSSDTRSTNGTPATTLQSTTQATKVMDMSKTKHHAQLIMRSPAVKETITVNADDSESTRTISTRKRRRGRGVRLHHNTVAAIRTPFVLEKLFC